MWEHGEYIISRGEARVTRLEFITWLDENLDILPLLAYLISVKNVTLVSNGLKCLNA